MSKINKSDFLTLLRKKFFVFIGLIFILSFQNTPSAFSQGSGPGNGGHVVQVDDDHYYLLDFLEGGVEKTPYFSEPYSDLESQRFLKRAESILARIGFKEHLSARGYHLLLQKLTSLPGLERNQFLSVMMIYNWSWVNAPLNKVKNLKSIIDLSQYKVWTAAVRLDNGITFTNPIWKKLNDENQVGLVFHEIIFSMIRPILVSNGIYEQNRWNASVINRGLFKESTFYTQLSSYQRNSIPLLTLFPENSFENEYYWFLSYHGNSSDIISVGSGNGRRVGIDFLPSFTLNPYRSLMKGDFPDNYTSLDYSHFPTLKTNKKLIEDLCYTILNSPKSELYLLESFVESTTTLKDYQSETGPTQYVSFDYHYVVGESYSSNGPGANDHFESQGFILLKYKTKAECELDLYSQIEKTYQSLHYRYDYK